jgi:hypothetical protein
MPDSGWPVAIRGGNCPQPPTWRIVAVSRINLTAHTVTTAYFIDPRPSATSRAMTVTLETRH